MLCVIDVYDDDDVYMMLMLWCLCDVCDIYNDDVNRWTSMLHYNDEILWAWL